LTEAIRKYVSTEKSLAADDLPKDQYDEAEARFTVAQHPVMELADTLPTPARSLTDVILRAQIAFCLARKRGRGIDASDPDEVAAARLIEAVHQFTDIRYS
jgi:hypothetical protein